MYCPFPSKVNTHPVNTLSVIMQIYTIIAAVLNAIYILLFLVFTKELRYLANPQNEPAVV